MKNSEHESDLILRLRKLERSQVRYRAAFLVTAALAAVLCIMGAGRQTSDSLQSKSFEVVNDDAKVLARFSSVNGKGEFRSFRADGNPLVSLYSSSDDSGRVEVYNASGKPVITLSTATTGAGSLVVNTSSGERAVQIGSTAANHGGLWIFNADGKTIAVITAAAGTSDGMAETYDAAGTRTGHLP
ncbi:MAG: hypothetical protein ACHQ50_04290 [Fimbriimonadales bacterium]